MWNFQRKHWTQNVKRKIFFSILTVFLNLWFDLKFVWLWIKQNLISRKRLRVFKKAKKDKNKFSPKSQRPGSNPWPLGLTTHTTTRQPSVLSSYLSYYFLCVYLYHVDFYWLIKAQLLELLLLAYFEYLFQVFDFP